MTVGTLHGLAAEAANLLEPLQVDFAAGSSDGLFLSIGLHTPPGMTDDPTLATPLSGGSAAAADMVARASELAEALIADQAATIATAGAAVLGAVKTVTDSVDQVRAALDTLGTSFPGLTGQQRAELTAFAGEFPTRLMDRLLVGYLDRRFPAARRALVLAGVLEITEEAGDAAGSLQATFDRTVFHYDRLAKLVTDPGEALRRAYLWGQPTFDGLALFQTLHDFLEREFGQASVILTPPGLPATFEAGGVSATVRDSENPPALDVSLRVSLQESVDDSVAADDWEVTVAAAASFDADTEITWRPLIDVELTAPGTTADVAVSFDAERSTGAEPQLLFGTADGPRFEATGISLGADVGGSWTTVGDRVSLEPTLRARLRSCRLVIAGDDPIVDAVLSGTELEALFDLGFTWSPDEGLRIQGGKFCRTGHPQTGIKRGHDKYPAQRHDGVFQLDTRVADHAVVTAFGDHRDFMVQLPGNGIGPGAGGNHELVCFNPTAAFRQHADS